MLPTHVGVVMDGNRRWAKKAGFANPGAGHDVGADHVEDLLGWCTRWRIDHLTRALTTRAELSPTIVHVHGSGAPDPRPDVQIHTHARF